MSVEITTMPHRTKRRGWVATIAAVASLGLVLVGCTGQSGNDAKALDTLNIVGAAAPVTLDPMLASVKGSQNYFLNLAYATLIHLNSDGELVPDLAESWKFTDTESKVLEVKLRDGLKFADGSALTADAVAQSLKYAQENGVNGEWLKPIASITAPDDTTIVITTSSPYAVLPFLLSNRTLTGSVISPAGLADKDAMKAASFGAGEYVLDADQTIINDTYVYTANENYWDQSKIHFKKVVVKIAGSQPAALQSIQSGEAQLMFGDATTAQAAEASGLKVQTQPVGFMGIIFTDQQGKLTPALADVRVRQALNYAIDREAIVKGIYGEKYATPGTSILASPQDTGYTKEADTAYQYDMDKAKALLAEAGYADGFSFDMQTITADSTWAQAVVEDWSKLGVKVKLDVFSDQGQYVAASLDKKYSAQAFDVGGTGGMDLQVAHFFTGGVTYFNPWGVEDPTITELAEQAAASADPDVRQQAYADLLNRAILEDAWTAIVLHPNYPTIYDESKIDGVKMGALLGFVDMGWDIRPAE